MKTLALFALTLAVTLAVPAPPPGVAQIPDLVKKEHSPLVDVKVEGPELQKNIEDEDQGVVEKLIPINVAESEPMDEDSDVELTEVEKTSQGGRYLLKIGEKRYDISVQEDEGSFPDGYMTVQIKGEGVDKEVLVPLNTRFFHIHIHFHAHLHVHVRVHFHAYLHVHVSRG